MVKYKNIVRFKYSFIKKIDMHARFVVLVLNTTLGGAVRAPVFGYQVL